MKRRPQGRVKGLIGDQSQTDPFGQEALESTSKQDVIDQMLADSGDDSSGWYEDVNANPMLKRVSDFFDVDPEVVRDDKAERAGADGLTIDNTIHIAPDVELDDSAESLIVHEMAHIKQNEGGTGDEPDSPGDVEGEADQAESAYSAGKMPLLSADQGSIPRARKPSGTVKRTPEPQAPPQLTPLREQRPGKPATNLDPAAAIAAVEKLKKTYPKEVADLNELLKVLKSADQASRLIGLSDSKMVDDDNGRQTGAGYKKEVTSTYNSMVQKAPDGKDVSGGGSGGEVWQVTKAIKGRSWGDWNNWVTATDGALGKTRWLLRKIFSQKTGYSRFQHESDRTLLLGTVLPACFQWALPVLNSRVEATNMAVKNALGRNGPGGQKDNSTPAIQAFKVLVSEVAARVPKSSAFDAPRFGATLGPINASNTKVNDQMAANGLKGALSLDAILKIVAPAPGAIDKVFGLGGGVNNAHGYMTIARTQFGKLSNAALLAVVNQAMSRSTPGLTDAQKKSAFALTGVNLATLGKPPRR